MPKPPFRMTVRGSGGRALPFGRPDQQSPEGFRFTVADPDGTPLRVVIVPRPQERLGEARWVDARDAFDHGDLVRMRVEAPAGLEGRRISFIVEHSADGAAWSEYEVVAAVIESGAAEAPLEVHHPVFSRHNPDPHEDDVAAAPPARLRFHAELAG